MNGNLRDTVGKAILIIGSLIGTAFAIDNRYVTEKVFDQFKDGAIVTLTSRLDRIENKLDRLLEERRNHR